jgi:hypothetical protein
MSLRKLHNEELHSCTLHKKYIERSSHEDEMGKPCSTRGGVEECIQDFGGKGRRKETIMKTRRRMAAP